MICESITFPFLLSLQKLHLEEFMLYAHGSDLCHELELRHAMANCFEALMGALLLDGGIDVGDKVFSSALWMDQKDLKDVCCDIADSLPFLATTTFQLIFVV